MLIDDGVSPPVRHGADPGGPATILTLEADGAATIVVPDAPLLFGGDYVRSGFDLVIGNGDSRLTIHDYFRPGHKARLSTPDGRTLDPEVVDALTVAPHGPVTAQAGPAAAAPVVGRVETVTGTATAIRNGTPVILNRGDLVYRGDALQTASSSSLGVSFVDGTLFNLAGNARMVLNEMVYAPSGTANSSLMSLVQGSITFLAGQTAKTGDMRVATPVATMGIRGTLPWAEITSENGEVRVRTTVLREPDGTIGRFDMIRPDGTVMATVSDAALIYQFGPGGSVQTQPSTPSDQATFTLFVAQIGQLASLLASNNVIAGQTVPVPSGFGSGPGGGTGGGGGGGGSGSSGSQDLTNSASGRPQGGTAVPEPGTGIGGGTPTPPPAASDGSGAPPPSSGGGSGSRSGSGGTGSGGTTPLPDPGTAAPIPIPDPGTTVPPLSSLRIDLPQGGVVVAASAGADGLLAGATGARITLARAAAGDVAVAAGEAATAIPGTYGTLALRPDGTYVYVASRSTALAQGETGTDVFTVTVDDGTGTPRAITATFAVAGVNDAPTVSERATIATTEGGGAFDVLLLAGAADPDNGAALHAENVRWTGSAVPGALPAGFSLGTDGRLRVDPSAPGLDHLAQGAAFTATFTYDVVDEFGARVSQTVTVTVDGTNDAPTAAGPVGVTVTEGGAPLTLDLLAGASDPDDGAVLRFENVRLASGGPLPPGLSFDAALHRVTVDPGHPAFDGLAAGRTAEIALAYTVVDEVGARLDRIATVTVIGTNDAPVAADDVAGVTAGGERAATGRAAGLLANDTDVDSGETASLRIVSVRTIGDRGPDARTPAGDGYLSAGHTLVGGLGGVAGFGENALPVADDDSSALIDLTAIFAGGVNFFGRTYTSLFLNNNGNVTFGSALGTYTPTTIGGGTALPIIAPFWADVDTYGGAASATLGGTSTGANRVWYDIDAASGVLTITWDDVGYFDKHADRLNAFQLQLVRNGTGGDFDIVFRYEDVNWTTGDASGGAGGVGGRPARAGYSSGDGTAYFELPQSGSADAMLGLEGTIGNTGIAGVFVFNVRNGQVAQDRPLVDGTVTIGGTYGTLLLREDGTYRYVADAATALAQGEVAPDVFTYTVADPSGATSTATLRLDVTGVNDAPVVIDDTRAIDPAAFDETGVTVASFLGSGTDASVGDADRGALRGVAVTGFGASGGAWQYQLAGETTWRAFESGGYSAASALLLSDTDHVRLQSFGGGAAAAGSLAYKAWDQTAGTHGDRADASAGGGTSAFSTGSASAEASAPAARPASAGEALVFLARSGDSSTLSVPESALLFNDRQANPDRTLAVDGTSGNASYGTSPEHRFFVAKDQGSFDYTLRDAGTSAVSDPATVTLARVESGTLLVGTAGDDVIVGQDGLSNVLFGGGGNPGSGNGRDVFVMSRGEAPGQTGIAHILPDYVGAEDAIDIARLFARGRYDDGTGDAQLDVVRSGTPNRLDLTILNQGTGQTEIVAHLDAAPAIGDVLVIWQDHQHVVSYDFSV